MKTIPKLLFKLYSNIPYAFFIVFLLVLMISLLANGTVTLNDTFMDMAPIAIMAMACVAGIFAFPLVAASVLVYNWRKWKKLMYPVASYGLYLAAVVLAGYMGWWTD